MDVLWIAGLGLLWREMVLLVKSFQKLESPREAAMIPLEMRYSLGGICAVRCWPLGTWAHARMAER